MKVAKLLYKLRYGFWRAVLNASHRAVSEDTLNQTQRWFCEWNAERLGISFEASKRRYLHSLAALPGGPRDVGFQLFNELSHEIFRPFADDSPGEVAETYRFHACLHFLMMLGYDEPVWGPEDHIVQCLPTEGPVSILDYGCGLAQASRGLALVNLPTIRKPFLAWMGERMGIAVKSLDVTPETPIPDLPDCDGCFATEVFEHRRTPVFFAC